MSKILLKNVRLSFPSIFERNIFNGTVGKYTATFLIEKSKQEKLIAELYSTINAVKAKANVKVASSNYALKDGLDSDYSDYHKSMSLKASSDKRPTVINRDKSPITKDDEIIYPGCVVNAVIDFWCQNNSWGKRVNANLYGIQFVADAERFGVDDFDASDDFLDLEEQPKFEKTGGLAGVDINVL